MPSETATKVASTGKEQRSPKLDRSRLLGFRPLDVIASELSAETLELLHNKIGEVPPPAPTARED